MRSLDYHVNSPVLLLVFNRPDETRKVLDAVSQARPARLYIAADAPREGRPTDSELCAKTLALFSELSWPCQIFLRVNQMNLGSHTHIPRAVSWFFENEEAGIVLEDDCVPSNGFFMFCDEMLRKYENDARVMWVNGSNVGFTADSSGADYSYSNYAISWGWASWRRSWITFGSGHLMPDDEFRELDFDHIPVDGLLRRAYWRQSILYAFAVKNWDLRWLYLMWTQSGLAITPHANLVTNVGFGIPAVHGGNHDDPRGNVPFGSLSHDMVAPNDSRVNKAVDSFFERTLYKIGVANIFKMFLARRFPRLRATYRKAMRKHG